MGIPGVPNQDLPRFLAGVAMGAIKEQGGIPAQPDSRLAYAIALTRT